MLVAYSSLAYFSNKLPHDSSKIYSLVDATDMDNHRVNGPYSKMESLTFKSASNFKNNCKNMQTLNLHPFHNMTVSYGCSIVTSVMYRILHVRLSEFQPLEKQRLLMPLEQATYLQVDFYMDW
jgi:hypothetical protein